MRINSISHIAKNNAYQKRDKLPKKLNVFTCNERNKNLYYYFS